MLVFPLVSNQPPLIQSLRAVGSTIRLGGYFLAAMFVIGCSGFKGPEPISTDSLVKADPVEAAQTLRETYQQANKVEAFRGSYQGIIDSPAGRIQFRLVVAFVRPEKLRLEVLFSGLNRLATLLTISDGRISLLDANGKRHYSGAVSADLLAKLTGVPLSAAEMMMWFSGRYRPETAGQIGNYAVYGGVEPIAVFGLTGDRNVIIRQCTGRTGVLEAFELRTGSNQNEALLTRYDCTGAGNDLPKSIHFWLPDDRAEGVLTLESGKLNPDLKNAPKVLFEPDSPAGLEEIPIDEASKGALLGAR